MHVGGDGSVGRQVVQVLGDGNTLRAAAASQTAIAPCGIARLRCRLLAAVSTVACVWAPWWPGGSGARFAVPASNRTVEVLAGRPAHSLHFGVLPPRPEPRPRICLQPSAQIRAVDSAHTEVLQVNHPSDHPNQARRAPMPAHRKSLAKAEIPTRRDQPHLATRRKMLGTAADLRSSRPVPDLTPNVRDHGIPEQPTRLRWSTHTDKSRPVRSTSAAYSGPGPVGSRRTGGPPGESHEYPDFTSDAWPIVGFGRCTCAPRAGPCERARTGTPTLVPAVLQQCDETERDE